MAEDLTVLRCPSCNAVVGGPGVCAYCGAQIVSKSATDRPEVSGDEPPWVLEARKLVAEGKKIHAIKLVRWHTNCGLKEAKDLVESGDLDDPVKAAKLPPGRTEPVPESSCFPAHARVWTPLGPRPIAGLRRGDAVWAWHRREGRVAARVTATIVHPWSRLWRVAFRDGGGIDTTAVHRFATARGWRCACELRPGDQVLRAAGPARPVCSVGATDALCPVYNLHTSGPHNFVVEGVVVHNFSALPALRTAMHRLFLDHPRLRPRFGATLPTPAS